MQKGQTVLRNKLQKIGLSKQQEDAVVDIMRDWAINDIIQVDEHITLEGEPFDTVNKIYDVANSYKREMRERVKSQTKQSTIEENEVETHWINPDGTHNDQIKCVDRKRDCSQCNNH